MTSNAFLGPTLALAVGLLTPTTTAQTVVETFTGTCTINYSLPGTPDGNGGLNFAYTSTLNSVAFTPGSVLFDGVPVDFDGTEALFLASSFSGTQNFPVLAGPAVVDTTGTGTCSGALNADGTRECTSVDLGSGFSASNFDLVVGGDYDGRDHVTWTSPVVPELDAWQCHVEFGAAVTGSFAATGTIDISFSGQIVVLPCEVSPTGCAGDPAPRCIGAPSTSVGFALACDGSPASLGCIAPPVMLIGLPSVVAIPVPPPIGCSPLCLLGVNPSFGTFPDPTIVGPGLPLGFTLAAQCGCIASAPLGGLCVNLGDSLAFTIVP